MKTPEELKRKLAAARRMARNAAKVAAAIAANPGAGWVYAIGCARAQATGAARLAHLARPDLRLDQYAEPAEPFAQAIADGIDAHLMTGHTLGCRCNECAGVTT
jgi:hypothetical protein